MFIMAFHSAVNNVISNDVAVAKAQSLSQEHNVKATAYKVDGELAEPSVFIAW